MRVLVLGGTGFIGSRLCALLQGSGWATPVSASARRLATGVESVRLDTCDRAALRSALPFTSSNARPGSSMPVR